MTLWLIAKPTPGQFDHHHARRLVACLADALIARDLAAGIVTRRQAEIRRKMFSVPELSMKDFRDQRRRTALANAAKLGEHADLLATRYRLLLSSNRRARSQAT